MLLNISDQTRAVRATVQDADMFSYFLFVCVSALVDILFIEVGPCYISLK